MNRLMLYVLSGGLVVIGFTVWLCWPSQSSAAKVAPENARYCHCPKCGNEWKYLPKRMEIGCNRCGDDVPLVATAESIREKGGLPNPYGRMIASILIEFNVLMGVLLALFYYKPSAGAHDQEFRHTRCRACKRRLRFPASKVGSQGMCPSCRAPLVFPEGEVDEDAA